ncbi:uncharacterized protein LOC107372152 isoform X1 [Tetranychus urticae]|uniref:uncharacterized protein LOC107372152 isoform X1 n=1 Tax=Tetranychus urticae TaxID=32264 RepID=UPI00077B9E4A|nr:uncharacterized protein LOC107372152 isoform X1 [Tetranychus urticae]
MASPLGSFSGSSSHSLRSSRKDSNTGEPNSSSDVHHSHHSHNYGHFRSHSSSREGRSFVGTGGIVTGNPAWLQRKIHLRPALRGCHLITDEVLKQLPELSKFYVGMCHIHVLHTSASLALNENWDPDVREDMEMFLSRLVPESTPFRHSCEGPDDMPAHIKACFLGASLTIPVSDGKLTLGPWQGIWLCEHRNRAGSRQIVVTLNGFLKNEPS